MANYVSSAELGMFLLGASAITTDEKTFAITAASRLFDSLCSVEENYFAEVRAIDTENEDDDGTDLKTIAGNGLSILPLPPFIGGLEVTRDGNSIESGLYAIKGSAPNQYLEYGGNGSFGYWSIFNRYIWALENVYTVRARWGFEETPDDVKTAVIQIAISLLSDLDTAKARRLDSKVDAKNHLPENSFASLIVNKYKAQISSASGF